MICHFSCGSTSAVATLLTIYKNQCTDIVYADPGMEHESNGVFLEDFEKLTGRKITVVRSKQYKTPFDVFLDRKYLSGIGGAPCTTALKKIPIRDYLGERIHELPQVFGYTSDEHRRVERFIQNNPMVEICTPLIDECLSKNDCLGILDLLGLDLPQMYKMGYKNSNCIGCVKAYSLGYWAAIREDFPEIFEKYAKLERQLGAKDENGNPKGAALNKRYIKGVRHRLFLDELPENTKPARNLSFMCGYSCGTNQVEFDIVDDEQSKISKTAMTWAKKLKEYFN